VRSSGGPRGTAQEAAHLTPAQLAGLLRAASDVDLDTSVSRVREPLARVQGRLLVTVPKTAGSRPFRPDLRTR